MLTGLDFVYGEGTFATYTARLDKVALVSGISFALQGSATNLVKISRVKVGPSVATALGLQDITWQLSGAPTGGTLGTVPSADKYDSADVAATAVPAFYTAAPTQVGLLTTLVSEKLVSPAAGATSQFNVIEKTFGGRMGKCPTLRGTAQYLTLSADAALAGQVVDVEVDWVEFKL